MTTTADFSGSALPQRDNAAIITENIIIVSAISIITRHLDAITDMEFCSFDPPWTKNGFVEELKASDALMLLLLIKGIPKGYLCSRKLFDETHINKMCIHSGLRGRGYGKLLLNNFLCTVLAGYKGKIYLEVARSNVAAIALYHSAGFSLNRIRQKIYENGDDAFEMVLDRTCTASEKNCPGEPCNPDAEK